MIGGGEQVQDAPLKGGQLVYLHYYDVRGRHKIQDLWSSVVHQVVKGPQEGGVVYTVAPTDDLSKVKHVHRSLLKTRICMIPSPDWPDSSIAEYECPQEGEEPEEGDLFVLVPETPQDGGRQPPWNLASPRPGEGHMVPFEPEADSPPQVHPPTSSLGISESGVRRTRRSTAGQHSNVYHLPRPMGVGGSSSTVCSTAVVWFWPWS